MASLAPGIAFFAGGPFWATAACTSALNAQIVVVSVPTSGGINLDGSVITFTGLESPTPPGIFEVVIPASTEAQGLAARDFSAAVPADPNTLSISFDPTTAVWHLRNSNTPARGDSCRVLLVRNSSGSTDLTFWRARYGVTSLSSSEVDKGDPNGEANARQRTQYKMTYKAQRTAATPDNFETYLELKLTDSLISY